MTEDNTKKPVILLEQQEQLIEKAHFIKSEGIASELLSQFENPLIYKDMTFEQRMDACIDAQIEMNKQAAFATLYRKSRLQKKVRLQQIIPDKSRGVSQEFLQILREMRYIDLATNILICGATGTGKTALAIAAGMEAIYDGKSVLFYKMSDLSLILENKNEASLLRLKDTFRRTKLLIIDDYGMTDLSDKTLIRFFEIIDVRYGLGSTIITSQFNKKNLKKIIPDSPGSDALNDRLFRDSDHEIQLKGSSWRGKSGEISGR